MSNVIEFLAWLLTCFVAISGFVYTYYKFTNVKNFLNIKFIMLFILCVIFLTCVYYFDITFLGVVSYFLISPILFYFMNFKNLKEFIFYVFIIWIYALILDLIAMATVSVLHYFFKFNIYGYIFECIMSMFLFILLVILSNNKIVKNYTNKICTRLFNIKYFDVSLVLFSFFSLIVSILICFNLKHIKTSASLILILTITIFAFGMLIISRAYAAEVELFLKNLKENNDFYIKMENENRVFRHNLNAKLLSIKSVSNAQARTLLNSLLRENNKSFNCSESIRNVPYGFNGIIYEKIYQYIEKINITINNEINYDIFEKLKPRRYNVLVEKMVIALDNAIEASLKSKDKIIIINLYDEGGVIFIEIINTFIGRIELDNLGSVGYSTKGKRRGLGLFSILRYKEVSVEIKIQDGIFINKLSTKVNK